MLIWRLMNRSDIDGVSDLMAKPRLARLTSLAGIPAQTVRKHAQALLDRDVWCETAWVSGKCVGMVALRETHEGCAWLSVVLDSERLGLWNAMQCAARAVLSMQEAASQDAVFMCRTHVDNSASKRILWRNGWMCDTVDNPWAIWHWKPEYAPRITGVATHGKRRIDGGTNIGGQPE